MGSGRSCRAGVARYALAGRRPRPGARDWRPGMGSGRWRVGSDCLGPLEPRDDRGHRRSRRAAVRVGPERPGARHARPGARGAASRRDLVRPSRKADSTKPLRSAREAARARLGDALAAGEVAGPGVGGAAGGEAEDGPLPPAVLRRYAAPPSATACRRPLWRIWACRRRRFLWQSASSSCRQRK